MIAPAADAHMLRNLIILGIGNHIVLGGSRVTVSLDALAAGASTFTVGLLMSLFALLPMVSAIAVGRFADRVGVRRPMQLGSIGLVAGALLPAAIPGLPTLFVSAALVGVSFMVFQVAAQQATGALGLATDRARNFSLLAMGYSISGLVGPLIAGLAIDHLGFRPAFGLLAMVAIGPAIALSVRRMPFPRAELAPASRATDGVMTLLRHPTLRRAFATNALFAVGWDLHGLFMPIYGRGLGLTASQIGVVLSTFAAATFVVRLGMPALMRRWTDRQVLAIALLMAGAVYLAFPFATGAHALMALSFVLGLALGSGQPMVMSLLHTHAPPGRVGEAVGVRMALVQTMSVSGPLIFGAVGASFGLAPVFWLVGLALAAGGFVSRRA